MAKIFRPIFLAAVLLLMAVSAVGSFFSQTWVGGLDKKLDFIYRIVGLRQPWTMFSGNFKENCILTGQALFEDGTVQDITLPDFKTNAPAKIFEAELVLKWRMKSCGKDEQSPYIQDLAAYLAQTLQTRLHSSGPVKSIKIYSTQVPIEVFGAPKTDADFTRRLVGNYAVSTIHK